MNEIVLEKFQLKEDDPNYGIFSEMIERHLLEMASSSRRISSLLERGLKIDEVFFDSIYTQEVECYMIRLGCVAIGFAIIGIGSNKHPDSDFFVAEFFVKKEYRNMGYGSSAFCKLVKNFYSQHPKNNAGRICLMCIKENKVAKMFLQNVFAKIGYSDVSEEYKESIVCIPQNCQSYMYQVKK